MKLIDVKIKTIKRSENIKVLLLSFVFAFLKDNAGATDITRCGSGLSENHMEKLLTECAKVFETNVSILLKMLEDHGYFKIQPKSFLPDFERGGGIYYNITPSFRELIFFIYKALRLPVGKSLNQDFTSLMEEKYFADHLYLIDTILDKVIGFTWDCYRDKFNEPSRWIGGQLDHSQIKFGCKVTRHEILNKRRNNVGYKNCL